MASKSIAAGDRFGRWTYVEPSAENKLKSVFRCECGITKDVNTKNVTRGLSKSCGCLAAGISRKTHISDRPKVGERFGRLIVVAEADQIKRVRRFECRCDCGNTTVVRRTNLMTGHTTSCGCAGKRKAESGKRYGLLTLIEEHPVRVLDCGFKQREGTFRCQCGTEIVRGIYNLHEGSSCAKCSMEYAVDSDLAVFWANNSWWSMKGRCGSTSPKFKAYKDVKIHSEWMDSFEAFLQHVGPRPHGTTLDRIDTTGDYVPGNVRWATRREQCENQKRGFWWIYQGQRYASARRLAEKLGVSDVTIRTWYKDQKNGITRERKYGTG